MEILDTSKLIYIVVSSNVDMLRTESMDMSGGRVHNSSVSTPPEDGAMYSNSSDYHTPSLASIYQVSMVIIKCRQLT